MTAPAGPGGEHRDHPGGNRTQDTDDFDVDEILALVRHASTTPHPQSPPPTLAPSVPTPAAPPHPPHPRATPWPEARDIAARAARPGPRSGAPRRTPTPVPLDAALGLTLAAPLDALTDLPPFDTSAMDGWAVAGPGPWTVRADGVLAGHAPAAPLADGEAVRIATGGRVPPDTTAVIRSEHGRLDDNSRLHPAREVGHGQDIRPRGQECRTGDQLLPPGTLITPAVLGLAAAAGYDTLTAVPRPRAEVLILGDELLTEGLPHDGLIRDALGPLLPPWLRALGAEITAVRRLGDDADALHKAVATSDADLLVTTGGTAAGPVDFVHPTLDRVGAELLVDGVQVRPGHPMLLARLAPGRHLVGLPGNPLAAVSGLLTLAEPLLRTLAARPAPQPYILPLRDAVQGHPRDTRLVPVVLRGDTAVPLHYNGPAMLRGIAAADALAVVPPGGTAAGQETELLDLPWASAGIAACFT
ncbi:molybdopterin molybdotransferase MoeA [Streptomyces sp. NPDC048290]|uniref:molybdopterin molybdotransferase MoeA n=1 Tax=Streptomyces sp. NPDC048290 TaxID=3155811 RepID=UPI00342E5F10